MIVKFFFIWCKLSVFDVLFLSLLIFKSGGEEKTDSKINCFYLNWLLFLFLIYFYVGKNLKSLLVYLTIENCSRAKKRKSSKTKSNVNRKKQNWKLKQPVKQRNKKTLSNKESYVDIKEWTCSVCEVTCNVSQINWIICRIYTVWAHVGRSVNEFCFLYE